jgi:hypothetical protein
VLNGRSVFVPQDVDELRVLSTELENLRLREEEQQKQLKALDAQLHPPKSKACAVM